MFPVRICAVLGCVMMASASAEAREVAFSVENRLGGDSNVFREDRSSKEKEDGFYEFSPRLKVEEKNRELNYSFLYNPTYEAYFDVGGVNGWDHRQHAIVDWRASPVDTLGFSQRYTQYRSLASDTRDVGGGEVISDESDSKKIRRATVDAYYSRVLTPTLSSRAGLEFQDVDFNTESRVDSRAIGGNLGVNHIVNPRLTLGLVAAGRYRESRGVGLQSDTDSYIGNVAASVSVELTPSMSLFARVGPSYIRSKEKLSNQLNVPPGTDGDKSNDVSVFALANFTKEWRKGLASISYSRSESANAGDASAIVDEITVRLVYRPSPVWVLRFSPRWQRSESVSDSSFSANSDRRVSSYWLAGSVERMITRRIKLIGTVRYVRVDQDRENVPGVTEVTNVATGFVALQYNFEPWKF